MVGFAAEGIDLAAHLLRYETEFLTYARARLFHRFAEITNMVGEAHFLFVDIELLEVVDHLLLKAVHVHCLFGFVSQFLEVIQ